MRSVDTNRHEDLQSFTSMYGSNDDSWYGVTVVSLFKTMLISDVKMSQIISEKKQPQRVVGRVYSTFS